MDPCSICLCDIVSSTRLVNCGHVFCQECISKWLLEKASCPYCRSDVNKFQVHDAFCFGIQTNLLVECVVKEYDFSVLPVLDIEYILDVSGLFDVGISYPKTFLIDKIFNTFMEFVNLDPVLTELFQKIPVSEKIEVGKAGEWTHKVLHSFKFY